MDPDQLSSVVSSAVTRAITEATRLQPRDTPESPAVSQPPATPQLPAATVSRRPPAVHLPPK